MISFIIPTKNEEKVIEKILRLLSEYKGEKEIIVSDGRSTDGTVAIAKRYAIVIEGDPTRPQRISSGKNNGAKVAHGEYLVFLDSDVSILDVNAFFKKALNFFKSNEKLVGLTGPIRVLPEYETLMDKIVFSSLNFYTKLLNNVFRIGGAVGEFQMVRKDIFEELGGYDENLVASEDYEFFRRLTKVGRTYFSDELKIYHTGRRAHIMGWPRLLREWILNGFFVFFSKKTYTKEWKVIR